MDDAPDRGESRAPQLQDVLDLCAALNRESARYALIGGFAVILHGFVRSTKDVDLLVDPAAENIRAVKRAMATLPDNAAALLADDEVLQYQVVRVADEFVPRVSQAKSILVYGDVSASVPQSLGARRLIVSAA